MAPKQNDREARQARERLRAYQARQTVHLHKAKRRRRDNWVAGIAAVVIVALAVGTQLLYFSAGPGAAKASSSASPSATPSAAATVPPKTLAEDRTWTGTMTINGVPLGVSLDAAPAGLVALGEERALREAREQAARAGLSRLLCVRVGARERRCPPDANRCRSGCEQIRSAK